MCDVAVKVLTGFHHEHVRDAEISGRGLGAELWKDFNSPFGAFDREEYCVE